MKRVLFLFALNVCALLAYSQSDYAVTFDGTDDSVQVSATAFNNLSAGTVEMWVYLSDNTDEILFAKQYNSVGTYAVISVGSYANAGGNHATGTAGIVYFHAQNNGLAPLTGSTALSTNTWYHIAITFNTSEATLYINGVQDGTASGNYSQPNAPSVTACAFGYWGGHGGGHPLNGRLDEIRIWNTVRSQTQIRDNMYSEIAASSTNLIGYYRCNEGSGTSLDDIASNNLDGTLGGGASWAASGANIAKYTPGNALDFVPGSSTYVTVPYESSHDLAAGGTLTLEAWVNPNGEGNILMKGNYGYGFYLSQSVVCGGAAGRRLMYWDQGGCASAIYSDIAFTNNQWQHVAVTVQDVGSQLEIRFYVNGVADPNNPHISSQSAISNGGSNQPLYIGRQGTGCNCNYMPGTMDELRIWNTVRSQSEIQSNMFGQLDPNSSGLVAYYRFDEGVSGGTNSGLTTLVDLSPNSNNGTLTNFSLSGSTSNWIQSNAWRIWTGESSNDFATAGNWGFSATPVSGGNILLPANGANYPVSLSGSASVGNVQVESGASATLTGSLSVAGQIYNSGTINATNGTIVYNGSTAQTISASTFASNTIKNLTINNSSGVTLGGTLGVTGVVTHTAGTLTTGGYLTLSATGPTTYGQIARTGSGSISGNITAQYMITGGGEGFRPICSPLSGATVAELSDDFTELNFGTPDSNYCNIWRFNESTSPFWTPATGTSQSMDAGAFSIYMGGSETWEHPLPITLDITGTYAGTGNYVVSSLTRTNSVTNQSGWHYIRNRWPSGFLWDGNYVAVITGGVQGGQVWVYDQSAGAYRPFDNATHGIIPPFHPFTLEVTANNTQLSFFNSGRTTDSLRNYFDKTSLPNFVEVQVSDANGKTDKVKFYTDANAANNYDVMDGNKMMNPGIHNLYFVQQDKNANKLVYNTLPAQNEPLSLSFEAKKAGPYTMAINTENLEPNTIVELIDKQSGATHNIEKGDYTFTHDLNNTAERFELKFSKKSTTTNVADVQTGAVYVGSTGNTITIAAQTAGNYTVEIVDMLGRNVQAPVSYTSTGSNTQSITINGVQTGYYIVKITGENVFKTAKVFLK